MRVRNEEGCRVWCSESRREKKRWLSGWGDRRGV
ncbi:MARTX multifunctional-autoprocessing repeats in-toxin holotoxin [Klebsiella phage vB_KpnM-VAC66]|nr:MARTX multifunctional-autoprocessing repeats in-toxin holotoxin [Klebsiella phage vB_KpnM-VAC66]